MSLLVLSFVYVSIESVGNSLSSFVFLKQELSRIILFLRSIADCTVQIGLTGLPSLGSLHH